MQKIKWKYEIGNRFIDYKENKSLKRDLTIIDKEIRPRQIYDKRYKKEIILHEKYYKYHCNVCGWNDGYIRESHLSKGVNCSCCTKQTIVKGINDLATLRPDLLKYIYNEDDAYNNTINSNKVITTICPVCKTKKQLSVQNLSKRYYHCDYCLSVGCQREDLIQYFENKDEAFKYSLHSGVKVNMVCPTCKKFKKKMIVGDLVNQGFRCPICNDGVSYPESFFSSFLIQKKINFETQVSNKTFNWCENFRYDFYLPNYNCIVETHGNQHYKENTFCFRGGKTLQDEKNNDEIKMKLALNNGIKNYVVLDCRKSNVDWIKNSILKSELTRMFDCNNVDWIQCNKDACKSIQREVCDYWEKNKDLYVSDLKDYFHLSTFCIRNYLKKGAENGWCTYNPELEIIRGRNKMLESSRKPLKMLKDGIEILRSESISLLSKNAYEKYNVKLDTSTISKVCLGKKKSYKGYTFQYIKENKEENKNEEKYDVAL